MALVKPWKRKSNETWYVTLSGKQVPLGKDEREAWKEFNRLVPPDTNGETDDVRGLVDRYLNFVANSADHSAKTYEIDSGHLNSFADSLGEYFPLADVIGQHLTDWADRRFADCSPTTKNQGMRTVKACWAWGCQQGILKANALKYAKMPTPKIREVFFASDQWQAIVSAAKNAQFRDYLTVILESGVRPQEMHKAQVRHYQNGRIVFPKDESKGKKRCRVVPLNPASVAIVERLIAGREPNAYIFLNTAGKPWNKDSIGCAVRRLRKKANFPGLVATACRHSFAYASLTQGSEPMAVSKAMGHVDTRMIETRYGHVETNLEYLDRGKTLKENPFLPSVNGKAAKVNGKAGAPPVNRRNRQVGSHPRPEYTGSVENNG